MSKHQQKKPDAPKAVEPQWSVAELIAVAHLGPAIIGPEMHAAAQAYARQNGGTALGPATRGE